MSTRLSVELGPRSYDILIGHGLIAEAGRHIAPVLKSSRAILVTDSNVAEHHLAPLEKSLHQAGIAVHSITLPAGEASKGFAELERLIDQLLELSPDRKTALIALGGGVIGDITGFAASILLRGVDFIQVPTTLLAQVDSAVGGKTGINTRQGKNLVGSFHQPRLVLSDTGTLKTLPERELRAGYAEVAKYAIINDADFFSWLEENGQRALAGDEQALAHLIHKSCEAKASIVAQDERESGVRALLNFGHTLGHALEAEAGFSDKLLHGEAIAVGMVLALKLSVRLGFCPTEDAARAERHLRAMGLKTNTGELGLTLKASRLIEHCRHDKKASGGAFTFILAKAIGKCFISHEVRESDLAGLLAETL